MFRQFGAVRSTLILWLLPHYFFCWAELEGRDPQAFIRRVDAVEFLNDSSLHLLLDVFLIPRRIHLKGKRGTSMKLCLSCCQIVKTVEIVKSVEGVQNVKVAKITRLVRVEV